MKVCRSCKIEKVETEFVKSKAFKSGIDTICLVCSRERVKIHRKKNKLPRSNYRRTSTSTAYRNIIIDYLVKRDGLICTMCNELIEDTKYHIDHIIPVALGGLDIMENIRLTHPTCNMGQSNIIRKQRHGF